MSDKTTKLYLSLRITLTSAKALLEQVDESINYKELIYTNYYLMICSK